MRVAGWWIGERNRLRGELGTVREMERKQMGARGLLAKVVLEVEAEATAWTEHVLLCKV
jgi:hypothetical protein